MTDLFNYGFDEYPNAPGWKARSTSRQAAESVKAKAPRIQDRIIALLEPGRQLTADEGADLLGLPILTVRPRFSELGKLGKLRDTGLRRTNDSGKKAVVWALAA